MLDVFVHKIEQISWWLKLICTTQNKIIFFAGIFFFYFLFLFLFLYVVALFKPVIQEEQGGSLKLYDSK